MKFAALILICAAGHWRQVKRNPLKFSRLGQKNYEKALT
jgi:hypothetical protein